MRNVSMPMSHDTHNIKEVKGSLGNLARRGTALLIQSDFIEMQKQFEVDQQAIEENGDSHLSILDRIHQSQNHKLLEKIATLRDGLQRGIKIKDKTYHEELIEELEARVIQKFHMENFKANRDQVTEIHNISAKHFESDANKEKLNGKFDLRLNKNLTKPQKIIKFGHEPVVFYLHKKRNYLEKIETQHYDEQKMKNQKEEELQLIRENEQLLQNTLSLNLQLERQRTIKKDTITGGSESMHDTSINLIDTCLDEASSHASMVSSQQYQIGHHGLNAAEKPNSNLQVGNQNDAADNSNDEIKDELNSKSQSVIKDAPPFKGKRNSKFNTIGAKYESRSQMSSQYPVNLRYKKPTIKIIESGQDLTGYKNAVMNQLSNEHFENELYRHEMISPSQQSMHGLIKGQQVPKFQNPQRDYYRYNILHNRLAEHSLKSRTRNMSIQEYDSTKQKTQQYESANDIIIKARNQVAKVVRKEQQQLPTLRDNSAIGKIYTLTQLNEDSAHTEGHIADKKSVHFNMLPKIDKRTQKPSFNKRSESVQHSKSVGLTGLRSPTNIKIISKQLKRLNSPTHILKRTKSKKEDKLGEQQKDDHNQISNIIKQCADAAKETTRRDTQFNQSLKEINMKQEDFERTLNILGEVEVDQIGMIESTFNYKLNIKNEEEINEIKAIRDYHNGAEGISKINSKFQQKREQKKLKEQRTKMKMNALRFDMQGLD